MVVSAGYVINSMAWSIVGFAAGITLSRLGGGMRRRSRVAAAWVWRWVKKVGIGGVLILLALATTISLYTVQHRISEQTSCQAKFNADFREAINRRAQYNDQDTKVQKELNNALQVMVQKLLTAMSSAPYDPGKIPSALSDYNAQVKKLNAQRDETARQRAAHPLPKLGERCDE